MDIHLDVSELVANPLRSGIQRVEREAIRHWPDPAQLIPCLVDGKGGVRRLPPETLDVLRAHEDGTLTSRNAEREALRQLASVSQPEADSSVLRILNLEL